MPQEALWSRNRTGNDEMREEGYFKKKAAPSSNPPPGNAGIGLASVAAAKGYRETILTLSETMSVERRNLLKALRCRKLVLTEGSRQ